MENKEKILGFDLLLNKFARSEKIKPYLHDNIPNLFRITGISNKELQHSNFIAWLLNPKENHKIGDRFLKKFLEYLSVDKSSIFCENVSIERELWLEGGPIDIAIILGNGTPVLIENKIESNESEEQTIRYRESARIEFGMEPYCCYLTPWGIPAEDTEWKTLSYIKLANLIEKSIADEVVSGITEYILSSYIQTIKEDIMGDLDLKAKVFREYYTLNSDEIESLQKIVKVMPPTSILRDIKESLKGSKLMNEFTTDFSEEWEEIWIKNKNWKCGNLPKAAYFLNLSLDKNEVTVPVIGIFGSNKWWDDKKDWRKYGSKPILKSLESEKGTEFIYHSEEYENEASNCVIRFKINKCFNQTSYLTTVENISKSIIKFIELTKKTIEYNWIPEE